MTENKNLMHDQQRETDPRRLEAWRVAAAAYRLHYNEGADGAFKAATAEVRKVMPELTMKEASAVAVAAVSYASQYHSKWLYALHVPKHER